MEGLASGNSSTHSARPNGAKWSNLSDFINYKSFPSHHPLDVDSSQSWTNKNSIDCVEEEEEEAEARGDSLLCWLDNYKVHRQFRLEDSYFVSNEPFHATQTGPKILMAPSTSIFEWSPVRHESPRALIFWCADIKAN